MIGEVIFLGVGAAWAGSVDVSVSRGDESSTARLSNVAACSWQSVKLKKGEDSIDIDLYVGGTSESGETQVDVSMRWYSPVGQFRSAPVFGIAGSGDAEVTIDGATLKVAIADFEEGVVCPEPRASRSRSTSTVRRHTRSDHSPPSSDP